MKTVILVPRREGFPDRDRLWSWCRGWWQYRLPEYPMVEGHHDVGLFNRSAAVNVASANAGAWDVAVIIDADVICDPERVRAAVAMAHETGRMVVPFQTRHNLSRRGSERVIAGDEGSWKRYIERSFEDQHSSVIAVPRVLWDRIGGFDEMFAGWGQEDTAFAIACETFTGERLPHLPGEVWHLWHATAPEGKRGTPSAIRNRARADRYRAAWNDPDAIDALLVEGREAAVARSDGRIPRILHRVVPEQSPPEAETWWARFGELHPGWRLMTHRDPLDPAEWPLTSPHWQACGTGAQMAGLVRLEALLRWGGIFVDWDVQPFRSLEPLLSVPAFAAWEDERVIPDAVLGAVPGHPAIEACLEQAVKLIPRGAWDSGPGVTTKLLQGRDDVLLLPPGSFYPIHYRDPEREAKMRDFDPKAAPWTFGLHHYWGSWLAPARRRVPDIEVAA